jgi:hypothetical protein
VNQRSISEEEIKLLLELKKGYEGKFDGEFRWDHQPKELGGRKCIAVQFAVPERREAQTQFSAFLMDIALLSTSEPEVYDFLDYEDWTLWDYEMFGKSHLYYFPHLFRAYEDD